MNNGTALTHWQLLPINQVAALKLKEAGEVADPGALSVFQLMGWGLLNGLKPTHRRTVMELDRLQLVEPEKALIYLTDNFPGGRRALERLLLQLPPLAAAELLIDTLDMRLKADPLNSYPV